MTKLLAGLALAAALTTASAQDYSIVVPNGNGYTVFNPDNTFQQYLPNGNGGYGVFGPGGYQSITPNGNGSWIIFNYGDDDSNRSFVPPHHHRR